MKRFHVHAHVQDLQASIAFYSKMFGTEPPRIESSNMHQRAFEERPLEQNSSSTSTRAQY